MACFCACLGLCRAQITGDIEVRVQDPSGAPIPAAKVEVRGEETGIRRSTECDGTGVALLRQLNVGAYSVEVSAPSFTAHLGRAEVNSGATVTVEMKLQIRTAEQQITVVAEASLLQTAAPQIQNAVDSRKIASLPVGIVSGPLNIGGGVILSLAGTSPGVTPQLQRSVPQNPGSFSVNGNRGRSNNITIDNVTAVDVVTAGAMGLQTVPLDAMRELNIITTNFNAEYGRNSGAQVQILTRSGSNEFHGSAFDFFRNSRLNARDYFDRTGAATPLRSNDFGAALGGPIRKNRLFFFGHYQQIRTRGSAETRIANVPRSDQVTNSIDPTAAVLLERLQVPVSPTGIVTTTSPQTADFHGVSARSDINLTDRDVLYARYGFADYLFRSPPTTFNGSNLPTSGSGIANTPMNATVSYTHTFGSRAVNQLTASYGRSVPTSPPLYDLGGPTILFADNSASAFGWARNLVSMRLQNTYQYADTLTFGKGLHQWKIGGEFSRIQSNTYNDQNERGVFQFSSISDFLAGRPQTYTQRFGNSYRGLRVSNYSFFIQDDWRPARRLTFNLGMRVEMAGGPSEVNGLLSNLNFGKAEPVGGAGTGPLGAFDVGGSAYRSNWSWAPRIGFAWNPSGGPLVVRGGYGIAYDFPFLSIVTLNLRATPPLMLTRSTTDFSGSNSFANLLQRTSEFQRSGAAAVGSFPANVRNFGDLTVVDQGLRRPQVHQWSLTFERQFSSHLVARASYVGTKGNYLQRQMPINTIQPGTVSPPTSIEEENAMRQAGVFTRIQSGLAASASSQSIRIDPRFNAVTYITSSANSNYHSAQFFVQRRLTTGYSISAAYTISKSIDDVSDAQTGYANDSPDQQNPFDNRNNRAVSVFDVPQRLAIVSSFDPVLSHRFSNPALRAVLADWQFQGIFQAQSGMPLTLLAGNKFGLTDPLLLGGNGVQRPDVSGPVSLRFDANPGGGVNPNKVTGSGLSQPLVGHFGTVGRNTIRINPLIQADWTLGKTFRLTERTSAQLQAHVYNVFNNTTFSRPGRILTAQDFGYYNLTDSESRNVTLVFRILW